MKVKRPKIDYGAIVFLTIGINVLTLLLLSDPLLAKPLMDQTNDTCQILCLSLNQKKVVMPNGQTVSYELLPHTKYYG